MTDHRATDLSYGHLGEASYNIDETEWGFSKELNRSQHIQQILPFKQCIPPSIQTIPETLKRAWHTTRSQFKWLTKTHPETFPAVHISSKLALTPTPSAIQTDFPPTSGELLAIGRAANVDHITGSRTVPIVAMPSGEAGNILQLIRPRLEKHGWEKHDGIRLSLLDLASSDQGHWIGAGGTIRQITFADNEYGDGTWFAVRQAAVTTIFRPIYRKLPVPFIPPTGYPRSYPPSRLSPNPIAILTVERSGSRTHVDVSFNPWYTHQFAVVDQLGRWSLWDIEGRKNKRTTWDLSAGRSGQVYDDLLDYQNVKESSQADCWHRVLWAGSASTLIVCNRCHLAVFDVKAKPTRLNSPEFVASNASDSILDIKRSCMNLSHIFVLTSTRVFWVEVTASGEHDHARNHGAKIILSTRHFRDTTDNTLKLSILSDDMVSTVLVCSSKSSLVNSYRFSSSAGTSGPTCLYGSIILETESDNDEHPRSRLLQTLYVTPATLTSNASVRTAGLGRRYMERGVKFHQIWALRIDLELATTLCATSLVDDVENINTNLDPVLPPMTQVAQGRNAIGSRHVMDDLFIVVDGLDEDILEDSAFQRFRSSAGRERHSTMMGNMRNDLSLRVNSRTIFQRSFMNVDTTIGPDIQGVNSPNASETATALLQRITDCVEQGKERNHLPLSTFLELSQFVTFSEDLDQASIKLHGFLQSLSLDSDTDAQSKTIVSDLTTSPEIRLLSSRDVETSFPELLKIYDQLVALWMTSLPLRATGPTRLAKFKIIRKVAAELCLSSVAVSLQNKLSQSKGIPDVPADESLVLSSSRKGGRASRSDSSVFLAFGNSLDPLQEADLSLPTSTRTPLYSYESTISAGETNEDPVVSRLRQYAVSIKSQPEVNSVKSTILSHWPSTLGVDPMQYSWESTTKASAARQELESREEDDSASRREAARRRRRTEKFLKQERARVSEAAFQPSFLPFGSQPEVAQHAPSSQVVDSIPMTQPDRGIFGSRPVKQSKKRRRRRAAGF